MIPSEFFCRACDRTVQFDERVTGRFDGAYVITADRLLDPLERPAVVFHSCRTVLFARAMNVEDVQRVAKELFG